MNILVLCTGNSARSILLECLLRRLGDGLITTYSAGSQPAGIVHPQSIALLSAKGYDVSTLSSKSWDVFVDGDAPKMDAVITVCGSAASETCPIWPGVPLRAHWGVEDPAAVEGPDAVAAFQTAYAILHRRAAKFVAGDIAKMGRSELQAHLTACGNVA
ncbi:arsenate reductase ArsC [uncultured Sulfitobacter sp.]|uniref:arsenate reductase ArsC n=1 Tax=uncultured Sulfitobacter sp. TaxID=191468 RepID=UPI002627D396|nr:arsenate reductase ArsC [uncultured Sulfitobacter sp.]